MSSTTFSRIFSPAVVAVLTFCTFLIAASVSPTMRPGLDTLFDVIRPNFLVPAAAQISEIDGVSVPVLSRVSVGNDDLVHTAFLDPGVYTVSRFSRWHGTTHFPLQATVILVALVVPASVVLSVSPSTGAHRWLAFADASQLTAEH